MYVFPPDVTGHSVAFSQFSLFKLSYMMLQCLSSCTVTFLRGPQLSLSSRGHHTHQSVSLLVCQHCREVIMLAVYPGRHHHLLIRLKQGQ